MNRITVQPAPLPSGVVIPAGYNVSVNLKSVHRNPDIYPNPDVFDAFRFSRLRDNGDGDNLDAKLGFTTVNRDVSGVL
jgi:cytochrome P450